MGLAARRLRLAALLAIPLLLFAGAAPAQTPPPARLNPELTGRAFGGADGAQPTHALTIGKLDVAVDIVGGVARTTVLATFQNPTARPMEGDFTLRLPPGAVVTGYGLDINGAMVDGVLTGQRQARKTYQARVRRGVDPGIAEVTREDAFRTHVFPIFPGAGRTIRLTFVAPVPGGGAFVLPLASLDPVGSVSVTVKTDAAAAPAIDTPQGLDLRWTTADGVQTASASARSILLSGALTVGATPPAPATLSRSADGDRFFEIDLPATAPARTTALGRVRIYWDTSLPRRKDDLAGELALLGRYLAATKPAGLELVTFADDGPKVAAYPSAEALIAALTGLRYDGATALRGAIAAGVAPADACLMFSAGRITLDPYRAEAATCPLFTLSSAADADHGFLTVLARKSGGEHLDLTAIGADAALARLLAPGARVTAVRDGAGTTLDFTLLPAAPGRVRLVGESAAADAVDVILADGRVLKADLSGLPVAEHEGMAALWATERVAELTATDRPDPDAPLRFARRYGVAAGGASFLVLEQLSDYVDAGVAPPASLGKGLHAEYAAEVARKAAADAAARKARLGEVIAAWNDQKAWWAGSEPRQSPKRPPGRGMAPAPPPPLAPPPVQARPAAVTPAMASPPSVAANADRAFALARPPPPHADGGEIVVAETVAVSSRRSDASPEPTAISVAMEPWDPKRPYLAALKAATPATFREVFDRQEARYGTAPAFYLDVAELLFRRGQAPEAIRMALDALTLPTADTSTLIIVADRMMRYGDERRAIWLYEKVLFLEPDRPQPRRGLALALVERAERDAKRGGDAAGRKADYVRALDLLNDVIVRPWDQAYSGIEMVALMEANHIVPRLQRLGVRNVGLDPRLRAPLDVDLRVTLEWNVDATDMDLWVDEPDGERAIYSNPATAIGGRLSRDMTQGYGPEEYLLRRAPSGAYVVRVNIYRTDTLNPNGAINVRARVFRDYGRPGESSRLLDLELKPGEDGARVVGTVTVAAKPVASKPVAPKP